MILRHSSPGDQRLESNTNFPNNFPGTMDGSTDSEVPVIVPAEITYLSNFVPCARGRAYKHGMATKCEGNN